MSDSRSIHVRFGELSLDEANARLTRKGVALDLPPKAFAVLCALARQPGKLLTKENLLDTVWGTRFVSESVLKSTISQLRAALEDDRKQPRFIETASRRGYRFVAKLEPVTDTPAPTAKTERVSSAGHVRPMSAYDRRSSSRERTLERLDAAWERASQGQRQIVWISGEAGIGKTTLLDTFVERSGNVLCARGQCVEPYGAGEPYLPMLDALASLCREDESLVAMVRSIAPTWLFQLPWLTAESERGALQRELAGASQDRMLREMGELLDRFTEKKPLLLITEDLHWSDHATVRLLDHVARRRTKGCLLWLGTFRPKDLDADGHAMKNVRSELRTQRLAQELPLEAFSLDELTLYLGAELPHAVIRDGFVSALHTHTGGLPLFVVNVLDDLLQQGAISESGDEELTERVLGAGLTVPESLTGLLDKQIARLPQEQRSLLALGSVCGMEIGPVLLADVLGRDAGLVRAELDKLADRHGWLEQSAVARGSDGVLEARYTFRHALYRHAIYQSLGPAMRAEMHVRTGDALARRRAAGASVPAAELAMHFERGHDPRRAIRFYQEASASAMRVFAPHESAAHAASALELLRQLPDDDEKLATELALTTTFAMAAGGALGFDSEKVVAASERARSLARIVPATAERAWVSSSVGFVFFERGMYDEACTIARHILEQAAAADDDVLRICGSHLLGTALAFSGDLREARALLEEGIALAESLGVDRVRSNLFFDPSVTLRSNMLHPLIHMGMLEAATEHADAAVARAKSAGDPLSQTLALWCAATLAIRFGELDRVEALGAELSRVVSEHGVKHGAGASLWVRGWAMAHRGEAEAGHALIVEGFGLHHGRGIRANCTVVLGYAAEAAMLMGDLDAAARHLERALTLATNVGETIKVPEILIRYGHLDVARGDLRGARIRWREALAHAAARGACGDEVEAVIELTSLPEVEDEDLDYLRDALGRLPPGVEKKLVAQAHKQLRQHRGDALVIEA